MWRDLPGVGLRAAVEKKFYLIWGEGGLYAGDCESESGVVVW